MQDSLLRAVVLGCYVSHPAQEQKNFGFMHEGSQCEGYDTKCRKLRDTIL